MEDRASDKPTRPNLAAVAALAGVSPSTASLAFSGAGPVSDATRARVLAAAEQLNYGGPDPRAQSLRRGRSGIVGVVMEDRLREAFRDPMNIAMLDGLADELGTAGLGLLLLTEPGSGGPELSVAPMDAVVLVGCSTQLDKSVVALHQRGIPVVAIEAEHMPDVLSIDLDNRDATATAARHLQQLGHSRVALVTLPLEPTHARGELTEERIAGSTAFTSKERIRGARDVFPSIGGVVAAGSSVEEGLIAGRELLAADRPTAVIAQSDLLALGVIRAAEELGIRVPDDLSVVGFDGVRIEGAAPYELTTLVQPAVEKGRAAGVAIVELLAGGSPAPRGFTSEFRVGNTTAAAR
ncbi:MAG: transcriptional regulator [Rhodoglobus sp.]|nr:transcriptional regulator [Rhodoglobus sp.]